MKDLDSAVFDNILDFTYQHSKYVKNTKKKKELNKIFCNSIKHIFTKEYSDNTIFVNTKGKVFMLWPIEGGGIYELSV